MTLLEWKAYYERKTGKPVKEKPFAKTLYHSAKGFMIYAACNGQLIIFETAGDGKHWQRVAIGIAKHYSCKELFTTIYVDPKVYQRRFPETKVYGTIMRQEVD